MIAWKPRLVISLGGVFSDGHPLSDKAEKKTFLNLFQISD